MVHCCLFFYLRCQVPFLCPMNMLIICKVNSLLLLDYNLHKRDDHANKYKLIVDKWSTADVFMQLSFLMDEIKIKIKVGK